MLAGQIGMDPGSLDLVGTPHSQLELIVRNYLQGITEVTKLPLEGTPAEKLDQVTTKAILYYTKQAEFDLS